MRKDRRTVTLIEGRHVHWCRQCNIVMLVLNSVFNFQSDSHQFSSHYNCFIIFADISLRAQCYFSPSAKVILPCFNILKIQGIKCARQFLWCDSSSSILKWLFLWELGGTRRFYPAALNDSDFMVQREIQENQISGLV